MIKVSEDGSKLILSPRKGYSHVGYKECAIDYAHSCPTCGNVVQALFDTNEQIDLWPYEETVILSQGEKNMGEILKVVPNERSKYGHSAYNQWFFQTPRGNGQKIVLRNHVLKLSAVNAKLMDDPTKALETGDRPCPSIGIFSLRPEITVKDYGLFHDMAPMEWKDYRVPSPEEFIPQGVRTKLGSILQSTGRRKLPMILTDREEMLFGGYNIELRPRLNTVFVKPKSEVNA